MFWILYSPLFITQEHFFATFYDPYASAINLWVMNKKFKSLDNKNNTIGVPFTIHNPIQLSQNPAFVV